MATFYQYAPESQAYTASGAAYDSGEYVAQNLAFLGEPRRTARSTDLASSPIVLDLGTHSGIAAFSFEGANFGSLLLEGNATNSWGAPSFSETVSVTGLNTWNGRRFRVYAPVASFAASYRYARITPSAPDSGTTYFELGSVGPWKTLRTLVDQWQLPYSRQPLAQTESIALGGGTIRYGVPGPFFTRLGLMRGFFWFDQSPDANAQLQWQELALRPDGTVFLWWETYLGVNHAFHVRRTTFADMGSPGTPQAVEVSGLELTEVA